MFRDNLYPGMLMNLTYFSVTFQSDHLTRPFVCTISHHFVALLLAEWLLMFLAAQWAKHSSEKLGDICLMKY